MALKTPFANQANSNTTLNSYVGGVRRAKAGRSARISPHEAKRVFSATGASLLAALLASVSTAVLAADPPPQVPAIQQSAVPATSAAVNSAEPPEPAKKWPPALQMLSPSAPLDIKARHSLAIVRRYQTRRAWTAPGPDGAVVFTFGATFPTVVCAPLQLCNIRLQPGEIVTHVDVGDPTFWSISPAVSGSGAAQITSLVVKPADAGLRTTLDIATNRRSYQMQLVSTQHEFFPLVKFSYPDDQAMQWGQYQQQIGAQSRQPPPTSGYIRYSISGDNPPWRPIEAYSDGQKTWIWFPPSMAYGKAPVLERLN